MSSSTPSESYWASPAANDASGCKDKEMEAAEWEAIRMFLRRQHIQYSGLLDVGCRDIGATRDQLPMRCEGFDPNPVGDTEEGDILKDTDARGEWDVVLMKRVLCNLPPSAQHTALDNALGYVARGGWLVSVEPSAVHWDRVNVTRNMAGLRVLTRPYFNYPVLTDSQLAHSLGCPGYEEAIAPGYYFWTRFLLPLLCRGDSPSYAACALRQALNLDHHHVDPCFGVHRLKAWRKK